jgi:hypothetical protein
MRVHLHGKYSCTWYNVTDLEVYGALADTRAYRLAQFKAGASGQVKLYLSSTDTMIVDDGE